MPVVFIPGKGNVQFPDDMTPYQIQLAIEREIIPGRKPETISATKRPKGTLANAWEGIKSTFASSAENQKQMVQERFGTPGSALESTLKGISVLGTAVPSFLQSASTTAQRGILDALGIETPPPPPPARAPSGPSLGKKIDYALGITSPEREKQEATERARRAAIYGERAVQTPAEMRRQDLAYEAASKQPEFDSILGEIGYAGAQSLAQMAPGLAVGALTRSVAPALGSAFTASSADQYYNVLERGGTKEEAALAANLVGATEVATEMLPTIAILKKFGRAGFGAFLKEYLSKDLPGELVATITQNAIDTAIANPDKTWGQYLSELPRDLVVTAGATLVPGATLATAGKAAQVVSNLGREQEPEDEILAAMQGKGPEVGAQRPAPPSPPPAEPADMGALTKALGPAGGKVTLQEPSGPQEYTFQGFDEDGSVLLEDVDGNVLAEDPGEIQQALKAGVAEPEMGVGAVAFGEDITEGLPEVEAEAPVPAVEAAPTEVTETEAVPTVAPKPLPLAKDASEIFGEYSQGRETETLQQIMQVASDMARKTGKKSITKDTLFKAGLQVDGVVPAAPKAAPAEDLKPELERIMGLFHPQLREMFMLPEVEKKIAEGTPFKTEDIPAAMYRNLKPDDRQIVAKALAENPQQFLDAARTTPFKTPAGDIVYPTGESIAPPELMPFDEDVGPYMQDYARLRTGQQMQRIESEARRIAAERGATSVSKEDMSQAAMAFDTVLNAGPAPKEAPKPKFTIEEVSEPVTAAPTPPPAAPAAVGKKARATIPTTREKVDVQYELQDLDNIRFAEGELQNRDRSRPQTQQFLRDFTSTFDPEGVGEDNSTDRGAPIINDENVILSGNGRTMGLEEIYASYPEQAQAYRDYLSELGYDTEGMKRPVLVRRLLSDVDQRKFVVNSNIADIAGLSPPEMARQDAQDVLTPELLAIYYGGDLTAAKNDAFVGRFIAKLSTKERADAMDAKGKPSLQVLQRIRNALLYKAYGESGRASEIFISKAMERADDDTKTLTNALVEAANDWIKFQQDIAAGKIDPKYDITNKIMEAVATVSDIKQRGLKVRDALRADDLVEPLDPFVKDILLAFHNEDVTRFVSKNVIANILNNYAETAAVQQATPDMLGMSQTPPADELWRRADRETPKTAKAQGQMFKSLEPIPVEQQEDVIEEARKTPSLSRGVAKLIKQRDKGLIDDAEFTARVTELADFIDYMKDERNYRVAQKGRVRGADRILEVLLAAKRRGEISPEAVDFMAWALQNNPNLANDLAISMRTAKDEDRSSGNYSPVSRLISLFKNRGSDSTAVHELLHHTEPMMPEDAQQAIRATWLKAFNKEAAKHTQSSPQKSFFQALRAFHSRSKFQFADETLPANKGYDVAMNLISSGFVPYSYYQYVNPSEFWAVNATDIMQKRYDVKDSTLGKMRNWLSEMVEKAKGLFGLSSKSPLIKALDSLSKADGKFNSLNMLQEEGAKYMDVSSLTGERNRRVLEKAQDLEKAGMKADIDALDEVIDDLNLVYESLPKDSPQRAEVDALEDRLSRLLDRIEDARRPSNENVSETEYEKASREAIEAEDAYNRFAFNFEDERPIMDRRTKAFKEWSKEHDRLEKIYRDASDRFEVALAKEKRAALDALNNGTPDEMKKAIAKIVEPEDKIMTERANLQNQNRGCD